MGGVLYRDKISLPLEENNELLLGYGMCDALHDQHQMGPKCYATTMPKDVLLRLLAHGLVLALATTFVLFLPAALDDERVPGEIRQSQTSFRLAHVIAYSCLLGLAWLLLLIVQMPKRVVRESDALVLEFPVYRRVVPLDDILELVVLNSGTQYRRFLRRWRIFPFGSTFRFFCGARSSQEAVCILLTRRQFWSFVFCLEDPTQFLLDNQRPLDLQATYKTRTKVALRDSESTDSEKVGVVPRGRLLTVEEQRGRRVLVQVKGSESRGWMSYISSRGSTLLARVEEDKSAKQAGIVGASRLARSEDMIECGPINPSASRHADAIE